MLSMRRTHEARRTVRLITNPHMSEKISYMGQQVWPRQTRARNGRYTFKSRIAHQWARFTAFLWKWTKRAIIVGAMVSALYIAYAIGILTKGHEVSATNVINIQAPTAQKLAPVMARIATAESRGHQYSSNGQITYNINLDGKKCTRCSLDMGKYQINVETWGATATKLGYDLTKEKDNEAFALWLYAEKGTSPWESSSANW